MDKNIFREYDIRGIVGKDINEDFAYNLGLAFGTYLKKVNPDPKWVSVGRDGRLSSESLANFVIKGIIKTGINVYDIGLCPTPLQYFSIFHLNLDGGIMVTGSHNPPEYNGFKISAGKETIFGEKIQEIKYIIEQKAFINNLSKGTVESFDIKTVYKDFMKKKFSYLSSDSFRNLKVVIDAGNGTGGIVSPEIIQSMGCKVILLYCEPDGRFPNHHPDPTVVDYIKDLIHTTIKEEADIGIGYDGDADRIGVIDNKGNIIWGDQLMVILARDILKRLPSSVFIADVKCSQSVFDDIEKNGGKAIMWKTGHSLVKNKMREEKAILAGEFSGHIFIADDYFGFDDALYTSFRIIEIMKKTGLNLKELLTGTPHLYHTPEIRVECEENKKKKIVDRL
ncbi:TPA: phosphomannomutase/phosphoglucomutase, partial [bacterium]|nr:phosphomannomutase/phosphoglucomutase [bacterium]